MEPVQIVVSWSEIKSWRTCPMQHWLDYRQRQPRRTGGPAQNVGTVWHLLMQDWYRGRESRLPANELATLVPAEHLTWTPVSEAEQELLATLLWMWDGFLVAGDPFKDGKVHAIEQEWRVPLPRVPGQPDHVTIILKAIIDLVICKGGDRYLVIDHKSQQKLENPESLTRDMDMDDQLGLYLYAMRFLLGVPATKLSAVWNYAVTTDLKKTPREPHERFWLAWSARTDAALDRIGIEATNTTLDAYARPLTVEPPRYPDKEHCRWRCGRREPCYYARDTNRPVELRTPERPDQAPDGVERTRY